MLLIFVSIKNYEIFREEIQLKVSQESIKKKFYRNIDNIGSKLQKCFSNR